MTFEEYKTISDACMAKMWGCVAFNLTMMVAVWISIYLSLPTPIVTLFIIMQWSTFGRMWFLSRERDRAFKTYMAAEDIRWRNLSTRWIADFIGGGGGGHSTQVTTLSGPDESINSRPSDNGH